MKIVARIRQLLSAKEDIAADVVEDIPELVEATPEPTFRRAIERPATPRPAPAPLPTFPWQPQLFRFSGNPWRAYEGRRSP
ncbi:MAG: hypothetical protein IPG72_07140 [Ardenticatenales bacterium]|nr:hypothetical protein [Ardenticatenales bacterium]